MGNVTSYPVTGLPQNITYYYRVRVNVTVNSCTGTSVNSNTISVSPTLHTNIAAYSNVFNETFGTGSSLPTGWSSTLTDWAVNSTSPSSGAGHYTGNSGDNNVWTNNPVETNASLYAPVVNFSGYTNGKLTFGLRKTSGFSRDLEIAVSLDNFATNAFTQTIHNADQPSDTWGLETIYLGNAIDNAASVYIRFRIPGTPVTGASSTIRIDDVILSSATPTITASGTLCTGGSITLTSSAGSTYLWSPTNETTQSINVTSAGTYSVQINGCVNSAPAVVTGQSTSDAPVITGTYCSGATTVSGTGVDGSTINVIRGGSSIGSTTVSGTTWSVNGLTLAASDALTATQLTPTKCVSAASTPAVTVQDITSAPVVSSTICDVATTVSGTSEPGASIIVYKAGSTQIGTATADGNGNWTTGTLSPAITTGDNITATATASGKCISIASSPAVTVILCCTAPSITGQPVDPAAVCPGTNSSDFSVTAAGTSPTYKWQRGISGTYVDISAATTPSDGCTYSNYSTATLTVANAPIGMNGYTYQCIVHGACGDDVTSDAKTLTVNTTPSAPSGSTSQSFCSSASHTVGDLTNAIGTAIQWYAASSGGTALSGSTALVDGTHYYASQTVSGCESNSRLDVTVTLNPASAGGFAALPQTICYSSSPADISLLGSTGNIQWQSSPDNSTWINISGATANPLTSAQMGPLTATTYYRAIVTSGVCTDVASTSVKVTVGPAINYGTASNTLGGANTQTICYNTSPASMSASGASGSSSFSYQWFSQTGAVTPTAGDNSGWTSAPGTGHNTATFSAPTAITGTTTFACWVTPGCGSANWAGASNNDNIQVTVDPAFSGGTLANNTQSICYNTQPSDITYSTPPAGGTTPTFQWYYLAGSHTTPSGVFSQV